MDYGRPVLADRLAAAYVLGTLRGPARRRLEALLPAHPALRQATAEWQQRLALLADGVPAVEPPTRVWERIAERTFGGTGPATAASAAPAAARWWQRAAPWRAFSGVATAAVLALLVVASRTPPPQAPVVVVLAATPDAAATIDARFVASVSADGRALVLRPLGNVSVSAGRALELWAVP
ncbi:MAG: anti-sigma factor, partial [Rubrivivax sp.]